MRCGVWTRWRRIAGIGLWVSAMGGVSGCASPPSVTLLLRSAETAIAQEQRLLEEDAQRQGAWVLQQRKLIEAGFMADLRSKPALEPQWVLEGTAVYVEAREQLLRHELELRQATEARRQNMRLAGRAIERGVSLLEQQDTLLADVPDLRRWLANSTKEQNR